jgi:adenylate cyclase
MAGVELHANVLETLIQGISIQRITRLGLILLTLGIGIVGIWLAHGFSPIPGGIAMVCLMTATMWACYMGLTYGHLWIDLVPFQGTLALAYTTHTIESYIKERQERLRLSQYFSPLVLTDILRRPTDQRLHTQRRTVTVLFSDIRNFSTISEQLTPEETAIFLRNYFTEVTDAVFQHGGMVDKYMGDATMALFNAPLDQPNHARKAVQTALDIQARVAILSRQFQADHGRELTCGIGIHTGEAIVGTMGSKQRFEYTAIGETINLGSRLENLTKEFHANIIFSEATYHLIKEHFPAQHLGLASIKGKDAPIDIYTVDRSSPGTLSL